MILELMSCLKYILDSDFLWNPAILIRSLKFMLYNGNFEFELTNHNTKSESDLYICTLKMLKTGVSLLI